MTRIDPDRGMETDAGRTLSTRDLLLIAVLSAVPRLGGLGHISLWLDEILGTLQTSGSLAETWQALKSVRVHPPLWGLLNWLTQQVTEAEAARRLVPIAFGIATVLLLADFVSRRFGRTAAIYCAVIAAFSPLHVRYSQELRAYSLGVLMIVLSLWLIDRAVERGRRRDWTLFALALWVSFATLYLSAMVLLPAMLVVLGAPKPAVERRRDLARFAFAIAVAGLAFAPWYGTVGEALEKQHELPATQWSLDLVAQRWHFLTAASQDGEGANAAALGLGLIALLGALAALRSHPGRVALVGLVFGSLGIELLLTLLNHWTNGRYSIASWPFLVIILALGCQSLASAAQRRVRSAGAASTGAVGRAAGVLAVLLVVGAEAVGLARYYRDGRPDWRSVASDVRRLVPAEQTIWVANEWTRISLGYYLAELEGGARPGVSADVQVAGLPAALQLGSAQGPCSALVVAGYPESSEFDDLFASTPGQRHYPRTAARMLMLPAASQRLEADPWRCFPRALEAESSESTPRLWRIPLRRAALDRRLEMVAADAEQLLFGWSFPERNRQGITFRWAVGHWAAVRLPSLGGRLTLRVWPYGAGQRLTVYRSRQPVAEFSLQRGPQNVELDWPRQPDSNWGEVVHLRFDEVIPASHDPRALAAGFDRIEIVEASGGGEK